MHVQQAPIQQPIAGDSLLTNQSWVLWTASVSTALKLSGTSFKVADLPEAKSYQIGSTSFASNGRKAGEGPGAGSGVPIWTDGVKWRTFYDNTEVMA